MYVRIHLLQQTVVTSSIRFYTPLLTRSHSNKRGSPQAWRCYCSSKSHKAISDVAWLTEDSSRDVCNDLDAIIVLGGGLREDGGLPEWVSRRLDTSFDLLCQQEKDCFVLCLGGGTPHKGVILTGQHVLHESTACAAYLMEKGVPASRLLRETSSYDTVGNGFFAASIHAVPANWRKCGIVTSAFHMPRARSIFKTCFSLAGKSMWNDAERFHLSFYAASDEDVFPQDVIHARHQREAQSLKEWQKNASKLDSFQQLHAWLHATHLCYSVSRQHEFGRPKGDVNQKALASY